MTKTSQKSGLKVTFSLTLDIFMFPSPILLLTLQLFLRILTLFFDPKKVKKRASNVAQNRPRPFYPTVQPRPQPTVQN